jgi:two-component system cell cycle sensor histidine kinase/response regulator CckA
MTAPWDPSARPADHAAMLLDNITEAVLWLDSKFLLRSWNRAAERIYGYLEDEVRGAPILEVLRTEYRRGSNFAATLCNVDRDGRITLDVRQYRKDGSPVEIEGVSVPLVDDAGLITGYVAVNREVTDRRRAEEALRRSEERLKLALAGTNDGLWDYNPTTGLVYVSAPWPQMLGYSSEEIDLDSEPLRTLFRPDDPGAREHVQAHMEGKSERYEYEQRLSLPGGDLKWILVRGKVVERGAGDVPIRITGTLSDVTVKKKTQASLLQADRMASMGALAAGVAHEINNPLSYVVANLTYSVDELRAALACATTGSEAIPDPCSISKSILEEAVRALYEARDGAERVRRIVLDLKTFSRVDGAEQGPVSVNSVLESSINLARNEIRHRARLVTELGDVPLVAGSEHRLGQVFVNLLINAAQAIPEGHAEENEIRVVTRTKSDGRIVVEISDTGCGIPAEILGHIFDPFFTTKPVGVGTGLGLSICHGIVGSLGGELQVESTTGKGSIFRAVFPPSTQVPVECRPEVGFLAQPPRGRILVVDDEPMVGLAVQRLLAAQHEVVVETAGRAALARLRQGECFDLVLCDLMMPDMTGMDLHDAIVESVPEAARRMVFFTGGAFTPRAQEFLERTEHQRIEKPFDKKVLLDLIVHHLAAQA